MWRTSVSKIFSKNLGGDAPKTAAGVEIVFHPMGGWKAHVGDKLWNPKTGETFTVTEVDSNNMGKAVGDG